MNKMNIKNIDCFDHIDEVDHYAQCIHFDCLHLHFSMWFAEIINKKSVVLTAMKHLCWCCINRKNIADITDTDDYKHYCFDRENCKKIEIFETDYINEINNYWKHYLNDKTDSAVQTVKIWQIWHNDYIYWIRFLLYSLCLQWRKISSSRY